jgi:hypothetical protein
VDRGGGQEALEGVSERAWLSVLRCNRAWGAARYLEKARVTCTFLLVFVEHFSLSPLEQGWMMNICKPYGCCRKCSIPPVA